MTNLRNIGLAVAVALAFVDHRICWAEGPFGFERGMTAEQVIELVGRQAVKESGSSKGFPLEGAEKRVPLTPEEFGATRQFTGHRFPALFPFAPEDGDTITYLRLTTAPKPHASFESYILKFWSQDGLLQIIAISPLIHIGADGKELRAQFEEISSGVVSSKGGRPDLRALPEMKYRGFLSDLTWKYSRSAFLKGDVGWMRTWEWRCKPIHRNKNIPPSWEEDYPCWYRGLQPPSDLLSWQQGN